METTTLPSESLSAFTAEKESATEKDSNECKHVKIFIPDLLARWPWPRRINPHYAAVKKESAAWTASFGAFGPKAQHAFNRCDFSKAFRPPTRSPCLFGLSNCKERAGCDVMNLFFVIDEYTDVAEPSEVRKQKDVIMDALREFLK
ncbi:hypothetical protein OG21DRAFT_1487446 [Imleria badia]|nr:hypothetical protein OG21DRAFT_1487446 [Imleria badia]